MSQRDKGFIRLEWTCPNCSTRNPGPLKTCSKCGAPQPDNVQFEVGANRDFVTDEAEIKQAAAGADIYCAYCNTRNPGNAKTCSQCGSDLVEGKQRTAGRELTPTPAAAQPVTCSNCGHVNEATASQCAQCGSPLKRTSVPQQPAAMSSVAAAPSTPAPAKPRKGVNKWLLGGIAAFLLICCVAGVAVFALPTQSVTGTVQSVHWQTAVDVQHQEEVHYSNESSAPSDAYNVSCHDETNQVCTDKTIDRGNGYAEVVQECRDETKPSCSYDRKEWKTLRTETEEGTDYNPFYTQPGLKSDERLGNKKATYEVFFSTEKGEKTYEPDNESEFSQFQPGTTWTLKLNLVGGVLDAQPRK